MNPLKRLSDEEVHASQSVNISIKPITKAKGEKMNVVDITRLYDIDKTYSKTITQKKGEDFSDWLDKVEAQRTKLERTIFIHKSQPYMAKFQVISLCKDFEDKAVNMLTRISNSVKFKWSFVEIR